ncbi:MAG TPA: hypothetical protein VNN73_18680 [Blastocatellia bacterium]|nr:hypothetical protein [Blastocatellia bacterium]
MADEKTENKNEAQPSSEQPDDYSLMRKGIRLKVTLDVEGMDAPAHNFAESTIQAVRDIIEAGSKKHPELTVKIKSIKES